MRALRKCLLQHCNTADMFLADWYRGESVYSLYPFTIPSRTEETQMALGHKKKLLLRPSSFRTSTKTCVGLDCDQQSFGRHPFVHCALGSEAAIA